MHRTSTILTLVACLLATACTPSYRMNVTTAKPLVAKPANCDFQTVAIPPSVAYEEIGVLSMTRATGDIVEFKKLVSADVCRVGGEIVVYQLNGAGAIIQAAVLRVVPGDPPAGREQ